MRGPHDDKIDGQHSERDHPRERLDEFLKRREPNVQPEGRENDAPRASRRKSGSKSGPKHAKSARKSGPKR